MNLIEAMDQHPGYLREDCEFLRLELMPCIAGLLALRDAQRKLLWKLVEHFRLS